MAEKGDEPTSSLQNLVCPMCLDIFEDATLLTCGHTFCRKCLQRYDASHQDLDHMVCPLCRKTTKFSDERVGGLPANVTVNGLVDEYVGDHGGMNAVLDLRAMCTNCNVQKDAISFCHECNNYMCDDCHFCHQKLSSLFADHRVVFMTDIASGKDSIHQQTERCKKHRSENKDLFCEDCKVQICFKCVIVGHRDHKIKNQDDFESELHKKVDDIVQRCNVKKTDLEKNIQNTEVRRQEIRIAVQKLKAEVREAYDEKARRLKENERVLLDDIESLQENFDDNLDALKTHDRQQIKSIVNSVTLVANDRLGRLETDSLLAHSLLCEELETILGEATDVTSAKHIERKAKRHKFLPVDDAPLAIGSCMTELLPIRVINEVTVKGRMSGMSAFSEEEVVLGYSKSYYGNVIDIKGKSNTTYMSGYYHPDVTVFRTGNVVISREYNELFIMNRNCKQVDSIVIQGCSGVYPQITSNHNNEILLASTVDKVVIYDSIGKTQKCVIKTKEKPMQAFETVSGAILSSSCNDTPSVINVYDRNGTLGGSLRAGEGEYLYATVDKHDRVYVANVNPVLGKVVIKLYDVQGLILEEIAECAELKLSVPDKWCYLVSLSPKMLAFASGKKLYFIEVDKKM